MQETPAKKLYFVHFPMVRADLTWIHRSVAYRPDLYPVVSYFTEYFGGGMSSVVFQQIREAKGLAYSAGAFFASPGRPDLHHYFLARVSTQADKALEAWRAMETLIDSVEVVPALAEVARQSLAAQLATERPRHEEIFYSFWGARRLGLPRERRADLWEALPSLKAEDLVRFHQAYLQHKPRLLLVMGDRNRIPLEAFRQAGLDVEEITLEALFGY